MPVHKKTRPILNYEQLFSSVFSTFHGQKKNSVRTKKWLNKIVKKKLKKIWEVFFGGLKTVFLGLAVFVYFGFST